MTDVLLARPLDPRAVLSALHDVVTQSEPDAWGELVVARLELNEAGLGPARAEFASATLALGRALMGFSPEARAVVADDLRNRGG